MLRNLAGESRVGKGNEPDAQGGSIDSPIPFVHYQHVFNRDSLRVNVPS